MIEMSIHIQLLTEDVINQKLLNGILELWNENAIETADCELEESERKGIQEQLEQYIESKYGAIYIATNENNEMIGFGMASIKRDFIYEVYVVPVYRRQKVAKRLVDDLVNWFNDEHDTSVVNVYVDLENDLALNFWEGIGLEKEFFMLSNN